MNAKNTIRNFILTYFFLFKRISVNLVCNVCSSKIEWLLCQKNLRFYSKAVDDRVITGIYFHDGILSTYLDAWIVCAHEHDDNFPNLL